MFEKLITPILCINDVKQAVMKVAGSHRHWRTPLGPQLYSKLQHPSTKPRSMTDSFSRAVVRLSDPDVCERYINSLNQVRFGRVLEDLDMFANFIGYKHNAIIHENEGGDRASFSLLTGCVDRILVAHPPVPNIDIQLSGHISWVGKSSLEATLSMEQVVKDEIRHLLKAHFMLVAIDPINKIPTPVTALKNTTSDEIEMHKKAEERSQQRRKLSELALARKAPTEEESSIIHDLYMQTLDASKHSFSARYKPSDDIWMKETSMKNIIICHPQNRNIHGNIFGGFLMRVAMELAWAQCWAVSRVRPFCVAMDNINFRKRVEIGSVLWMHQSLGYTDGDLMQSRVTVEVSDPNDPKRRELANAFHYTFRAPMQIERGMKKLPRVYPDSYGEAMLFLESRRRLLAAKKDLYPIHLRDGYNYDE